MSFGTASKSKSACCEAKALVNLAPKPGDPIWFCDACGAPTELSQRKEPFRRSTLSNVRKPTGEMDLFLDLYVKCGGKSVLSGLPLELPGSERFASCFSHLLPKGSYQRARLWPKNVMPVTPDEHRQWEENRDEARLLKLDIRWAKWIALRNWLREKYNTDPNYAGQ